MAKTVHHNEHFLVYLQDAYLDILCRKEKITEAHDLLWQAGAEPLEQEPSEREQRLNTLADIYHMIIAGPGAQPLFTTPITTGEGN